MARTDLAIALASAMLSIINYSLPAQASVNDKKDVATVSGAKPDVGATVTKDYFVVPIFYATNRSFAGDDGQIQYSEEPNGKGLLFGVKNIPAAAPNRSPIDTDTQNKMQWQKIQVSEKVTSEPTQQPASPSFDKSKCALKDKTLQSSEIVPAIKQYMEGTGNHEIVIFVHGCCATYDRSMQRAATVAAHMQVPVLLYDWVSPKGFKKYLENETRAEQTMDDFCRFLAKVEKLTDAGNVTIIGHSMGARFVDQALVRRGGNEGNSLPKFKEVIMSNADTDAKSFVNHIAQFTVNAQKSRIFFNNADDVLDASAIAHGGFARLGNPGALLPDLVKTDGLEMVDITANNSKHEIPFWIVANLHRYGNLGSASEFQLKQIGPGHLSVVRTGVSQLEPAPSFIECACK